MSERITKPPYEDTSYSVWTPKDEARLQELTERRLRIMRERRAPLEFLVRGMGLGEAYSPKLDDIIIEWLIMNAGALRIALLPFDGSA